MTTFTTEDRIGAEAIPEPSWRERWGDRWIDAIEKNWTNQNSIEYFWPLTEQIPLGLNFEGCEPPKLYTLSNTTVSNVPAQLTITPNNPVGQLTLGPMSIGLESEPKWYQKVLYKLLGFNWKNQ